MSAMLDGARELAPLIREHAAAGEAARRLDPAVVAALRDAGLFRICVPAALGGAELDPASMFAAIEAVAEADGAAGWCVAVSATAGLLAAYLEEPAAREIAGGSESVSCGVFAPMGKAAAADDGLKISGRWKLASGVDHADWVGLGCIRDDSTAAPGEYVYAILPRADVEVVDTWHSLGLRGTGSQDARVDGAVVPLERTAAIFSAGPRSDAALYRVTIYGIFALSIAAVCGGIARAAQDAILDLAGAKVPAGARRKLAERETTQAQLAASEGALRAARAGVESACAAAWSEAEAGQVVGMESRVGLRLAATQMARTAHDVVQAAHELAGASSIYEGSPLERLVRDINVATQHMVIAPATWTLSGRLMLGLETDATQL